MVGASDPHILFPIISFAKADIDGMACALLDNGDLYTTITLGEPREILIRVPQGFAGPFLGDCIKITVISPIATLGFQQAIENRFANTGPVTINSLFAGDLPDQDHLCPTNPGRHTWR